MLDHASLTDLSVKTTARRKVIQVKDYHSASDRMLVTSPILSNGELMLHLHIGLPNFELQVGSWDCSLGSSYPMGGGPHHSL